MYQVGIKEDNKNVILVEIEDFQVVVFGHWLI